MNNILRLPEVEKQTGIKKTSIYRGMSEGWFPRNYRIGETKAKGWNKRDINMFINGNFKRGVR